MNVLWLFSGAIIAVVVGYHVYSRHIARLIGEDPNRVTPAVTHADGTDYCPTGTPVVFAHHFASIAGAGPILGPTMALLYGVVPVWLWVLIGGIFIGAVHDYVSLFVSMQEQGKSIAAVAKASLGKGGFVLMISFTIVMIVLVTSAFLVASATSLTSLVSLAQLKLPETQTLLKTVIVNGESMGKIGGIASTSVIVMTICAPLIGLLIHKRRVSMAIAIPVAIAVCITSVAVGIIIPVSLGSTQWMIVLSAYTFLAAGVPVWILLQPRDFSNVFILYAGVVLLLTGAVGAGLQGVTTVAPLININEAAHAPALGNIWPFLFITVACGAISGFHALVTGGTVAKQVTSEPAARRIGYGGMLLETLLAIGVIIALSSGISFAEYTRIVHPEAGKANPILAFAMAMSGLMHKGLHVPMVYGTVFGILMVEGFVATTLDTAVRINRYLFEELWLMLFKNPPRWLRSYLFNSGISVALMLLFAFTNAFGAIWPIFGTANQLLAALTLITLAAWVGTHRKKNGFLLFPALFMVVTTLFSLVFLAQRYIERKNFILLSADLIMVLLAAALVVVWIKNRKMQRH